MPIEFEPREYNSLVIVEDNLRVLVWNYRCYWCAVKGGAIRLRLHAADYFTVIRRDHGEASYYRSECTAITRVLWRHWDLSVEQESRQNHGK